MKNLFLAGLLCTVFGLSAASPGIVEMRVGAAKIIAIQDVHSLMPAHLFTDTFKNNPVRLKLPRQFDSSVNVFLIRADNRNILVDTGYGAPRGTLAAKLAALGVAPESIGDILLTHLHPDHVGGLLAADGQKAFPNATLHVAARELEGNRSPALERFLKPYTVKPFKFNREIVAGIRGLDAAGHTPGHTVFACGEAWFTGDLVHAAGLQFAHPTFCASYDADPAEAVKTRMTFFKQAAAKHHPIFGAHIPFPGSGRVRAAGTTEGHFAFIPERF